ncbi:MAG: DHH family phosphoesterase [bacterium]
MQTVSKQLQQLDSVLDGKEHLLIVVHNHPDPDAIASAAALAHLAEHRIAITTSIAYGGFIGRAENQAMVKKLNIKLKVFNRIKLEKYDCLALVDGQPKAGNTPDLHYNIVIDHHPRRRDTKGDLVVVNPEIGVTATLLVEWLNKSKVEINADLATALVYAFISETQNLGRETGPRDIQAYLSIYEKTSMRRLSQIIHPKLPLSYFQTLAKTLHRAYFFKHLICAHMGEVPNTEIVSEMADFLLRRERISWSFCTGIFKDQFILSLRSSNPKAKAGKIIKHLTTDPYKVGGHDMMAGGYVSLKNKGEQDIKKLEQDLSLDFARTLGYKEVQWKPLLDVEEITDK